MRSGFRWPRRTASARSGDCAGLLCPRSPSSDSNSFADHQVGVVENERRTPCKEGALRRAPHNAPQSRKDESVYRHLVIAVVRCNAAEHVGDVVEPSQHEVVAEIELLHLRMRRHVVWVGHLEDAPGFATLDMSLELSRGEPRPSKEEGHC